MPEIRLGDIIEDYCTRCARVLDHSVVAIVNGEIRKVRCRTCDNEHDYRHGKGGEKKKSKQQSAFDQVLASIAPPGEAPVAEKRGRARRSTRKETG